MNNARVVISNPVPVKFAAWIRGDCRLDFGWQSLNDFALKRETKNDLLAQLTFKTGMHFS